MRNHDFLSQHTPWTSVPKYIRARIRDDGCTARIWCPMKVDDMRAYGFKFTSDSDDMILNLIEMLCVYLLVQFYTQGVDLQ